MKITTIDISELAVDGLTVETVRAVLAEAHPTRNPFIRYVDDLCLVRDGADLWTISLPFLRSVSECLAFLGRVQVHNKETAPLEMLAVLGRALVKLSCDDLPF